MKIRLIHDHDAEIAEWVYRHFKRRPVPPFRAIGAINEDGFLVGGLVINGYNGANCDVTLYGQGVITRRTIRDVLAYIFGDAPKGLACTRITARTRKTNRAMARLLPRLGFKAEGLQRLYYGAKKHSETHRPLQSNHAVVYGMVRDECPWLKRTSNGRTAGSGPQGYRRSARPNEQRDGHRAGQSQ